MNLLTEPYLTQVSQWSKAGRYILAQFDENSIVVYQAYRPAIGHFAASYGTHKIGLSILKTFPNLSSNNAKISKKVWQTC